MQKRYELTPMSYAELTSAHQNLSGMIIDAATEMLAEKFWPDSAEDVTAADMYVTVVGDCSGINFKLQIETDSSDAPSGSVVGAASSAFAGPNVAGGATQWLGGGTNPVNLGASCTVALNQPYWKVLYVTSGAPDGSHSIQLRGNFNSAPGDHKVRHHNGTNWTTTTAVTTESVSIVKYNSGKIQGFGCTAAAIRSATANDIYVNSNVNQVQGLRLKFGCQVKIPMVFLRLQKTGTPNDLVCTVYENDVSTKQTATIDDTYIQNGVRFCFRFASPVWLAPNKNINIVLSQTGTSDSHDYDTYTLSTIAAYYSLYYTSGQGFIYGNLGTPDALTLSTVEVPHIYPAIEFIESEMLTMYHSRINLLG